MSKSTADVNDNVTRSIKLYASLGDAMADLSGRAEVKSFMQAYEAETKSSEVYLRGYPVREWPGGALTAIVVSGESAYIGFVRSPRPGVRSGLDTRAMCRICEFADEYDVAELIVSSSGRGRPGLQMQELASWYRRLVELDEFAAVRHLFAAGHVSGQVTGDK